jgi:hypothetical protein
LYARNHDRQPCFAGCIRFAQGFVANEDGRLIATWCRAFVKCRIHLIIGSAVDTFGKHGVRHEDSVAENKQGNGLA